MADDNLRALGEDLISTSARLVRWIPRDGGFELSLAATRILARLSDNGPTRISDLATAERCSQPTITNHVKRLESAHLVQRSADPRDARAWMIGLTPQGTKKLVSMRVSLGASLEPFLQQLDPADLQALQQGIAAVRHLMTLDKVHR